jgi:hypothetical protein
MGKEVFVAGFRAVSDMQFFIDPTGDFFNAIKSDP